MNNEDGMEGNGIISVEDITNMIHYSRRSGYA